MIAGAFAAGAINSIAGGGTLITFPMLIWLGLDPKVANATSTVALWPGLFGGLFGYRKELEKSSALLLRLGLTSVIGGAIGAWLLIWTPSPTFARRSHSDFVATILFMAQGNQSLAAITASVAIRNHPGGWALLSSNSFLRCMAATSEPARQSHVAAMDCLDCTRSIALMASRISRDCITSIAV